MSLYEGSVPQMKKLLNQLDAWLTAGEAHAKKKSFDPSVLVAARLAPDQYPLLRQVQSASDAAKAAAARLTGKEPPSHPDTEKTMEELHARIRTCVAYLDTFTAADFVGADKRAISLPFLEGKSLLGGDYLNELALPNFYFHLATAYAILRHNGVELGKRDFIGSLKLI